MTFLYDFSNVSRLSGTIEVSFVRWRNNNDNFSILDICIQILSRFYGADIVQLD